MNKETETTGNYSELGSKADSNIKSIKKDTKTQNSLHSEKDVNKFMTIQLILEEFEEEFVADRVLDCIPKKNWKEMRGDIGWFISQKLQEYADQERKRITSIVQKEIAKSDKHEIAPLQRIMCEIIE